MTTRYTWRDNQNDLIVHKEEYTVKLVLMRSKPHTESIWLTPVEARNLASALLIAAEAIDEEKEKKS